MHDSEVFFFGVKIFQLPERDPISTLPIELSWRIFLYLDSSSLRNASRAYKKWNRIIVAHKTLRSRLNFFELRLQTGSEALAKFIVKQRNIRMMRKMKKARINYLSIEEDKVESPKRKAIRDGVLLPKSNINNVKRGGEDIRNCTKRRRIF